MKVQQNGKTLYHVQSVTDWHDEPYDMFVFSKNPPNEIELRRLLTEDSDFTEEDVDKQEINDLIKCANAYTVYTEEL